MKRLVVAARALDDLAEIAHYSRKQWGRSRTRAYLAEIERCFGEIGRNPAAGAPRDDIKPGYRSGRAGRHLVFYRETREAIEVLRVLHQSMDLARHLSDFTPGKIDLD